MKPDGTLVVAAEEDLDHYVDRAPGVVHPLDEPSGQEN
jgi:hypothetical protein